ncbi:uncharacterized protein [Eurosta solidaginis]|uniref:uncharacterized protein n=1 Tax=Eurosta solidaginis TaxID=178769 RepID=UPI0035316E55
MHKLYKISAFIISVLFCLKTFSTAIFALDCYPRSYQLEEEESDYAHPTTYLLFTFFLNVFGLLSGFWVFAGLYEKLYSFFSPALMGIVFFLGIDLLMHCVLIFIANSFHALMIFNLCTTAFFASCMYIVYHTSKHFETVNPEQVLHHDIRSRMTADNDQTTA